MHRGKKRKSSDQASSGGRKNPAGQEFMIHRDSSGQPCESTADGRLMDAIVYRYHRKFGFSKNAADAMEAAQNPEIAEAQQFHRQEGITDKLSEAQIIERWARFERWVLAKFSDHPYCKFLRDLKIDDGPSSADVESSSRKAFQPPTVGLVETYINHLRKNGLKGGTIRAYVGGITSTCAKFESAETPTENRTIRSLIACYEAEDGNQSTASFDFCTDLPKLHAACWSRKDKDKALLLWTMFLIAICLMARSSEMTDFCPLYEDIRLPEAHLWDVDGYPKFIEIALRDWKKRSAHNKGKPYYIRIHRNYLDPRFDPVFYLLRWLSWSGIQKGPIFQGIIPGKKREGKFKCTGKPLTSDTWSSHTARLFTEAGLFFPPSKDETGSAVKGHGCTNHAIRKSACQWAGRCGGSVLDVRNNGRWKSVEDVSHYHAQGMAQRGLQTEGGHKDPIRRIWVWKPPTVAGFDGTDQM